MMAARIRGGQRKGAGVMTLILNIILSLIARGIEEAWDLVGNYLLPSSIIQEKNFIESAKELGNLKNNVPAGLVGIFGIEFVGSLIMSFVNLGLVLFVILSFFIAATTGFWPIFLFALIILVVGNVAGGMIISMVKTIYFTVFFMAITMPNEIPKQYKESLTSYLKGGTTGKP